ncbi:MAG: CHAT domain-containing protein, partial [Planctomycetota bacterium]
YVIGMNAAIPDETAISFSVGFYKAIGAGKDIEFAYKLGINSVQLEGLHGDEIPQLITMA